MTIQRPIWERITDTRIHQMELQQKLQETHGKEIENECYFNPKINPTSDKIASQKVNHTYPSICYE